MSKTWNPDDAPEAADRRTIGGPSSPDGGAPSTDGDRYVYGELLGTGGMGEVRAATDRRLRRSVAIKRLLLSGSAARARFLGEAQVTAQLDHPNIVPVHDLGQDAEGRPFLAMKQVRGRSLRELLGAEAPEQGLSLGARLDVFRKVCDAIAFAHAHGVLHRDLKPDNVMVGAFGEVLVMDWGLARPVAQERTDQATRAPSHRWPMEPGPALAVDRFDDSSLRTHDGQVAGTPGYMAPEQAEGRLDALDERTDVYGLGALLYELLTSRPPFVGPVEGVLADVRAGRLTPPSAHVTVPRELDAVVCKCMALAPGDRYASVTALREDIDAYIERRPLPHVRSTLLERVGKWVDRHRAPVRAAAVVALLAAVVLLLGMARYLSDVGAARDQAVAEAARAGRAEQEARVQLVAARLALADSRREAGDITGAGAALREADRLAQGLSFDRRPLDWALSQHVLDSPPPVATCDLHSGREIVAVAVADGGHEVASVDRGGMLVRWAPEGCEERARVDVTSGQRLVQAALRYETAAGASSPTVVGLAVTASGATVLRGDRPLVTHPLLPMKPAGSGRADPGASQRVYHVRLRGDAGYVAAEAGTLRIGLVDGSRTPLGPGPADGAAWWPAEGHVLASSAATGGEKGGAYTAELRPVFVGGGVTDVDASGSAFVLGSAFGHQVRDLGTGAARWEHSDAATVVTEIVPRAGLLLAVRFDGSVHVDRLADGATVAGIEGQPSRAARVAGMSGDGRALALDRADGGIDLHLLPERHPTVLPVAFGSTAHAAAVSHDGTLLAIGADDGVLHLLDRRTFAQRLRLDGFAPGVRHLRFSPDDRTVLVGLRGGAIGLLDVATGILRTFDVGGRAPALDWIDASTVAAVTTAGDALRFDVRTGTRTPLGVLLPHSVWAATAVPGTRWLAVDGHGFTGAVDLAVVDADDGRVVSRRQTDAARYRIAAHPDGRVLASGTQHGTIEVWEPATGKVLHTLAADGGPTMGVAFSPDGTLLASTGFDGDVVLWDARTWSLLRRMRVHEGPGTAVEWLPDGAGILTTGGDRAVLLRLDAHMVHAAAVEALRGPASGRAAARAALGWDAP